MGYPGASAPEEAGGRLVRQAELREDEVSRDGLEDHLDAGPDGDAGRRLRAEGRGEEVGGVESFE